MPMPTVFDTEIYYCEDCVTSCSPVEAPSPLAALEDMCMEPVSVRHVYQDSQGWYHYSLGESVYSVREQ